MKKLLLILTVACLAFGTVHAQDDTVDFGIVEWPGVTVKTQVAMQILDAIGYDATVQAVSLPIVLRGVSEGDLDAFMAVWHPSMDSMIAPYLDEEGDGSISLVARNLEPTIYKPAVPTYVAEQGITSLADVGANAELFDNRFYGIEPGNDANEHVRTMIEEDIYGFGSFRIVESSAQGMLSALERATNREEHFVFIGWSPHWMNTVYDITYLEDPENFWGDDGFVTTAVNAEWAEENPNPTRFLSQLVLTPEIQSEWIERYSWDGGDPEDVARSWISENLDLVEEWLEGVQTIEGGDAFAAVEETFAN